MLIDLSCQRGNPRLQHLVLAHADSVVGDGDIGRSVVFGVVGGEVANANSAVECLVKVRVHRSSDE